MESCFTKFLQLVRVIIFKGCYFFKVKSAYKMFQKQKTLTYNVL